MKKALATLTLTLMAIVACANPVSPSAAKRYATAFAQHTLDHTPTLTLVDQRTADGITALYIFNVDDGGYVIVSADDCADPILGYSFEETFDTSNVAPAADYWLDLFAHQIAAATALGYPTSNRWKTDSSISTKSATYLLTTRWGQGYGYNNQCPAFNGDHAVTGCVATAMAQIMHFHKYPYRGFDSSFYYHSTYGYQRANYANAYYDHGLMPNSVNNRTSQDEIDALSLFNYHCGVSVNMDYQNPSDPDGSGTQSTLVPRGLKYFGYFRAIHRNRGGTDSEWENLLANDINGGFPLYYSGTNSTGNSHAFVVDGYDDGTHTFHFNWGWSGSSNGFYALQAVSGESLMLYPSAQTAVYNIIPSFIDSRITERFYIRHDISLGGGDGTSWGTAIGLSPDVVKYANDHHLDLWLAGGTYTATDDSTTILTLTKNIKVYGGFAGTEDSLEQRQPQQHPTILDGRHRNRLFDIVNTDNVDAVINNITFINAPDIEYGIGIMGRNITAQNCTFEGNTAQHTLINADRAVFNYCTFKNNSAPLLINYGLGRLATNLFIGNQGPLVRCNNVVTFINNTAYGSGEYALSLQNPQCAVTNSVIIGYDTAIVGCDTVENQVNYCAIANPRIGTGNIDLATYDSATLLTTLFIADTDLHLCPTSPLINSGKPGLINLTATDLDGNARLFADNVDIGCYEAPFLGIADSPATATLAAYPNPTTGMITISGLEAGQQVQLFTTDGKRLATHRTATESLSLDLADLPSGIYILTTGTAHIRIIR